MDGGPQRVLWYFGYGSNMKSSTMKSRGIEILETRAVKVSSYILTFDVFGLAYSEPSMASIARYEPSVDTSNDASKNPPDVHGVAFLITPADLTRLIASEGGGVAYREIIVDGICLDGDKKTIPMYALIAKYPRRPNATPSARYLRLLLEGAEEHKLPDTYQAYLRTIPCYTPSSLWLNRFGASLFLRVAKRVQRTLATRVKASIKMDGRCPEWYGTLIFISYTSMWFWHDYVFAVIFGPGNGGILQYGTLQFVDC